MPHELLTAAEMRAIESAAIESGAVTGRELMERAGRAVVDAMLAWRPELASKPHAALVLCGPGANGGDGFVVARLLADRRWRVCVRTIGDPERLPPDAAEALRRYARVGAVAPIDAPPDGSVPDVVIDAVFGAGLNRPLSSALTRSILGAIAPLRPPTGRFVAVDAPSGLCLDSGRILGGGMYLDWGAALTVTFHAPKRGHVLESGPDACGRLVVADILSGYGIPWNVLEPGRAVGLAWRSGAHVKREGHKRRHGHVLVLAGGVGRGGAARLAARASLRVGAGLVTVGAPPEALAENAARLDAVMLRAVEGPADLERLLEDGRVTTVAMGMGHGVDQRTRDMVRTVLETRIPVVLDADALTAFADAPEELWRLTHDYALLTPHFGEFRALFPDLAAELEVPAKTGPAYSRVDAATLASRRAGCAVLLKGRDTVIAAPLGGPVTVHAAAYDRAAPWLATAGAGDVLAGIAAGLMARGGLPHTAAAEAAWLHVEVARVVGPGLIAEDLPDALPRVFARMAAPDFRSSAF